MDIIDDLCMWGPVLAIFEFCDTQIVDVRGRMLSTSLLLESPNMPLVLGPSIRLRCYVLFINIISKSNPPQLFTGVLTTSFELL